MKVFLHLGAVEKTSYNLSIDGWHFYYKSKDVVNWFEKNNDENVKIDISSNEEGFSLDNLCNYSENNANVCLSHYIR